MLDNAVKSPSTESIDSPQAAERLAPSPGAIGERFVQSVNSTNVPRANDDGISVPSVN